MVSNGTPWTQIRVPMRIYRIPKGSCICLKIMVSPVRIRVPPLLKVLQNARKPNTLILALEPIYCNRTATGFEDESCALRMGCWIGHAASTLRQARR